MGHAWPAALARDVFAHTLTNPCRPLPTLWFAFIRSFVKRLLSRLYYFPFITLTCSFCWMSGIYFTGDIYEVKEVCVYNMLLICPLAFHMVLFFFIGTKVICKVFQCVKNFEVTGQLPLQCYHFILDCILRITILCLTVAINGIVLVI